MTKLYNLGCLYSTLEHLRASSSFVRVVDALDGCEPGVSMLRFDLERDVSHHLAIARWLGRMGIRSTFFVHTRAECFVPSALREIEDLGHEVGYHHECLDRCGGDWLRARSLFLHEVGLFRAHGLSLRTCCSHGENGIRRDGYSANWELMRRFPNLLTEAGVACEMYEWLRANPLMYATDTFRGVMKFFGVVDRARTEHRTLMMLVHAHRWRVSARVTAKEVAADLYQYAYNRVRGRRSYRLPQFPVTTVERSR